MAGVSNFEDVRRKPTRKTLGELESTETGYGFFLPKAGKTFLIC